MKLILIRHGQTDWNARHMVQGRNDLLLNHAGLRQAEDIGYFLKDMKISAVYSSPLQRAYQTAVRIAHSGEVIVDDRLIERDFGLWDGLSFSQISATYPDLWKAWRTAPAETEIPGAERIPEVAKRCLLFLEEIINRHDSAGEAVAIVSHTIPLKIIMAHFMKLPLNSIHEISMHNCGYNEIMVDSMESGVITAMNDVCFLHEDKAL